MAIFTSVQTGNFNDPATWDLGVGFPGISDTFLITTSHVVTIISGVSANTSGSVNGASIGTRAELVIDDGGELVLSADMTLTNYNKIQLNPGSVLDLNGFDLVSSTAPAGANFLEFLGTALNRVTVKSSTVGVGDIRRSDASGGAAMPGIHNIQYVDFLDCGKIKIGNNFNAGQDFIVKRSLFDGCDEATLGGFHNLSAAFELENIDFRNDRSLTSNIAVILHTVTGAGAGAKSIQSITAKPGAANILRWDTGDLDRSNLVTDRILHSSVLQRGSNLLDSACRIISPGGSGIDSGGLDSAVRTLLFSDSDNPHTNPATIDDLVDCVIDATYSTGFTDDGDHFILRADRDCTGTGNLVLDSRSGVFMNALGDAKSSAYVGNHNTLVGNYDAAYGALFRTETGGSISGTLDLYSNLIYNRSVTPGALGMLIDNPGDDQITNMDNNAWFGIDNRYQGVTSATKTPGVTVGYGGNDIADNPNFVDETRTFETWAGSFTGAATGDSGFDDLLLINGYDSINRTQNPTLITSNTVTSMVAWVRSGYAPTNSAYDGTAHDGGDIGAISYAAVSPTVTQSDATPEDGATQTFNTTNLTGPITAASLGGKDILALLSGVDPTASITYTLDVSATESTEGMPRIGEPSALSITATGGTAVDIVTIQPKTGWTVETLAPTLIKGVDDFLTLADSTLGIVTAVGDINYYNNERGEIITAQGVYTGGSTAPFQSTEFVIQQGGSSTATSASSGGDFYPFGQGALSSINDSATSEDLVDLSVLFSLEVEESGQVSDSTSVQSVEGGFNGVITATITVTPA